MYDCGSWANEGHVSPSLGLAAGQGGGCPEQQCPQQSRGGGEDGSVHFLVRVIENESGWMTESEALPLLALWQELSGRGDTIFA